MLSSSSHLLRTLLDLAHATSQNLDFAYHNRGISFGEETITETNLLEIRRRNPSKVRIFTFSKTAESNGTGADWEWHIIGKKYAFKMRVQAKRVNVRGSIHGISRQAQTAPMSQIDLLLCNAKKFQMKPTYCFYSSEHQRTFWRKRSLEEWDSFEAGCLLVDARDVKKLMPKRLSDIEYLTVPWHYLWSRQSYAASSKSYYQILHEPRTAPASDTAAPEQIFPTIEELNESIGEGSGAAMGLFKTEEVDLDEAVVGAIHRGITLLMTVDVREPDVML